MSGTKRFLVFSVILIVAVTIGFLTYYFLQDNEKLTANLGSYKKNIGEVWELEYDHYKPKVSTIVSVEALDASIVSYNSAEKKLTALKGGSTSLYISTTNENIPKIVVDIEVGDGTKSHPYFMRDVLDLKRIGTGQYEYDKHYILTADIDLSLESEWTPIGQDPATGALKGRFTGSLDGAYHTIYNLKVTQTNTNAGLFDTLGSSGEVSYLTFQNVNIDGSFDNAGAVAGVSHGTVALNELKSGSIINRKGDETSTGGFVGRLEYDSKNALVTKCYNIGRVSGAGYVGGLVGSSYAGTIYNCYSVATVSGINTVAKSVGGIVGYATHKQKEIADPDGIWRPIFVVVKDVYERGNVEKLTSGNSGNIIGTLNYDASLENGRYNITNALEMFKDPIVGCYYENENGDLSITGVGNMPDGELSNLQYIKGVSIDMLKNKATFVSNVSGGKNVNWDFENDWNIEVDITPTINYELGITAINLSSVNLGGITIKTAEDMEWIRQAPYATFVIEGLPSVVESGDESISCYTVNMSDASGNPIEWVPINEFTGRIITKNNCLIYNLKSIGAEKGGLFGEISAGASIVGLTIIMSEVSGINYAGAFAGVNKGSLLNCRVGEYNYAYETNIKLSGTEGDGYVGGFVGLNQGSIVSDLSIVAVAQSVIISTTRSGIVYCGGVAGKNTGNISSIYVTSLSSTINGSGEVNAGGVAGVNENLILNCGVGDVNSPSVDSGITVFSTDFYSLNVGSTTINTDLYSDKSYVGGISGRNMANGKIENSYTYSVMIGSVAGGITGENIGNINGCAASCDITAHIGGGLAGWMTHGARFTNSITTSKLSGRVLKSDWNDFGRAYPVSSVGCGFVGYIEVRANLKPEMTNCFSACSYGSNVRAYEETVTEFRMSDFANTFSIGTPGIIRNCVFDDSIRGDIRIEKSSKFFYSDAPNYLKSNNAECNGSDNYSIFKNNEYNTAYWYFGEQVNAASGENGNVKSGYPRLSNLKIAVMSQN